MRIANLFKKEVTRPINGVVKADQLDEQSIWQELDEFVVTQELDKHLRTFFERYCEAIDNANGGDVTGKIGVWISGFFGSGKSHFIKVLSYLLDNEPHSYKGETKKAVEFFENKIQDPLFFGDIKRAVASNTDVILFNIDSKADVAAGRNAILAVFLKVLNERQGYSGEYAHIAHMERYLADKGKLKGFHAAYREASGAEWVNDRDAYQFNRDQVVEALSKTLGQSQESCEKWVDSADSDFSLTVEYFAKCVKVYLDEKESGHRLILLVDEVGQFIGQDTHLMLNLQTITEELGTICKGRAWVVVTSQEDIDAVVGELTTSRANDFSKIQGRFKTRLSLSSANVDEVIQKRLLAKVDEARPELEALFKEKGDILKNQLTFRDIGTTYKQFQDADDFIRNYPFAPYQFKLLQRIFESIRKAGATGLHLAQGERSLLDAFQSAAKTVANQEIGVLVPLYLFYPAIESFLDTGVKRTIDHAAKNSSLETMDVKLLQVLFLIRYVDEIKGNVDNLVTLCLNEIDADRLGMKRQIDAGLQRLEKETLISRSGDNYFFLTNEERDVNREIKAMDLSGGEEARLLGDVIFEDVLRGQRKHRYTANKMDFTFTRVCDMHPVGNRVEGGLVVSVVTPLADDYDLYNEGKCIIASGDENGQVLIRLDDSEILGRELRVYLKTDKYLRTHDDGTLAPTARRINRDLAEENRHRRERICGVLTELMLSAGYYVAGQSFEPPGATPSAALDAALEYLIQNTFTKMSFLTHLHDKPLHEVQALLRSDDVAQQSLAMELPENNPPATQELQGYLELCARTSRKVVMHDMINDRFANRPYGWPEMEVVLLLTRLFVAGEIQFLMGGAAIPRDRIYECITTSSKWRNITVLQRVTANPEDVRTARELGRDLFAEMGPDAEDGLYMFLRGKLEGWLTDLTGYKALADTGNYPGKADIDAGLGIIRSLLPVQESNLFLQRFNAAKSDLGEMAENYHDLRNFYGPQKPTWDKLRAAHSRFTLNRMELERDEQAGKALRRMHEILTAPAPFALIREADELIRVASEVNDALVSQRREAAIRGLDAQRELVERDLTSAGNDPALSEACLGPLNRLKVQTASQPSLAHLAQAEAEAVNLRDAALAKISEFLNAKAAKTSGVNDKPVVKTTRIIKPASLASQDYLETAADVRKFLDALKSEMDEAVTKHERIEIR
jgi:hypothetical protein